MNRPRRGSPRSPDQGKNDNEEFVSELLGHWVRVMCGGMYQYTGYTVIIQRRQRRVRRKHPKR